jgi:hypothetical protein
MAYPTPVPTLCAVGVYHRRSIIAVKFPAPVPNLYRRIYHRGSVVAVLSRVGTILVRHQEIFRRPVIAMEISHIDTKIAHRRIISSAGPPFLCSTPSRVHVMRLRVISIPKPKLIMKSVTVLGSSDLANGGSASIDRYVSISIPAITCNSSTGNMM